MLTPINNEQPPNERSLINNDMCSSHRFLINSPALPGAPSSGILLDFPGSGDGNGQGSSHFSIGMGLEKDGKHLPTLSESQLCFAPRFPLVSHGKSRWKLFFPFILDHFLVFFFFPARSHLEQDPIPFIGRQRWMRSFNQRLS